MRSFLFWWIKYSLISIALFAVIYATGGASMDPPVGTWTQSFLILMTPFGALFGNFFCWVIKGMIRRQ